MFFGAIQLAVISRNFYCDAIIPVVQLFWCVGLDSLEQNHGVKMQTWTRSMGTVKAVVVLRCHKTIVLKDYGWTRQRFSSEGSVYVRGESRNSGSQPLMGLTIAEKMKPFFFLTNDFSSCGACRNFAIMFFLFCPTI